MAIKHLARVSYSYLLSLCIVRGKGVGLTDAAAPFLSAALSSSVIDFFSSSQSSSVIDFFSSLLVSCSSLASSFSSIPTSCSSIIDSSNFLNVVNFIWLSSSNTLSSTCQE